MGIVGLFGFDIVATIFGAGWVAARAASVIVGASAVWQIVPMLKSFGSDGDNSHHRQRFEMPWDWRNRETKH